jgi:hypothetical protein
MSTDENPLTITPSPGATCLPWLTLAALVLLLGPLFLRMPPTVDVAFYDICAETLLRGGILDRDIVMLQPPGMSWIVAAIHAGLGDSVVALRAVDLLVVAAIVSLLLRWQRSELSSPGLGWLGVAVAAFYLTTSEWLHAQPDTWMLLPALAALDLRRRLLGSPAPRWLALAEGVLWGFGCLIKPFVLLPGGLCWLWYIGRATAGERRELMRQAFLVFLGGMIVGLAWLGWLWIDGGWPYYLQKLSDWSGRYYATSAPPWRRLEPMLRAFMPWGAAHVIAIPYALWVLVRRPSQPAQTLLAVFYLGWLIEGNFIQSQNHYHILPSTLLAIAVAGVPLARLAASTRVWRLALTGALALSIALQPALRPRRLRLWPTCWSAPTTPALWNALTLDRRFTPNWEDLARVESYLREQDVTDGELSCFSMTTTHLYTHLRVKPASPYLFLSLVLYMYPDRRERVLAELRAGRERFVVADERELRFMEYPWSLPTVFRAGHLVVQASR